MWKPGGRVKIWNWHAHCADHGVLHACRTACAPMQTQAWVHSLENLSHQARFNAIAAVIAVVLATGETACGRSSAWMFPCPGNANALARPRRQVCHIAPAPARRKQPHDASTGTCGTTRAHRDCLLRATTAAVATWSPGSPTEVLPALLRCLRGKQQQVAEAKWRTTGAAAVGRRLNNMQVRAGSSTPSISHTHQQFAVPRGSIV